MTTFATMGGDPSALSGYASRYESFAQVILATATQLDSLVDEHASVGKSVDAVRGSAETTAAAIRTAQPRYRDTALALKEYAVHLQDAQERADRAAATGIREQDQLLPLLHRQGLLEGEHQRIMLYPAFATEEADWERAMRHLEAQIQPAEQSLQQATTTYEQAMADREHAAKVAMAKIDSALGALNDHLLDQVEQFLQGAGGFLAAVGKWVRDILEPLLIDLLLAAEAVGLALALAVLVLAFLPALVPLVVGVLDGSIDLATLKDAIIRALLVALPILLPAMALLLLREAATPTPKVTRREGLLGTQTISDKPTSYGDQMKYNGVLDNTGQSNYTAISVVEVLDADGNRVGWRVTLPSTMDWEFAQGFVNGDWLHTLQDRGALNDLGSNLALMMTPDQKAAYERAVIEAMKQAGIGPNDPVMMTGWSQGGILAGRMASDPSVPFNIKAIYVAGAPIDGMSIPPDVSVISLQHTGDPVPTLDGVEAGSQTHRDNWVTISTAPDNSAKPHENGTYTDTARDEVDTSTDPRVNHVKGLQSQFFSTNEINHTFSASE